MRSPVYLTFCTATLLALPLCVASADDLEFTDGTWVKVTPPAEGSVEAKVARIRKQVEQGKSGKAIKAARKFLKNHADNRACEEVLMLAGQAEMNRGRYYKAYGWFEKQLGRYPSGAHFNRSLNYEYDIAEAFLRGRKRRIGVIFRIGARDEGLEILSRIAEHARGSGTADKALMRIADFHFHRAQYPEAADAYDFYLVRFPKSPSAAHATFQAARATYAQFKGVAFDDTPLIDAEQRFANFEARFPLAAKRAGVRKKLVQIHSLRANKVYADARFYERVDRLDAAKYYYKQVIELYPNTSWADSARKDLDRLSDPSKTQPTTGHSPRVVPDFGPSGRHPTKEGGWKK